MSQLKSAEEILDNNWSPKMNLNWINREHLLAAMEEYATQFSPSPVSTDEKDLVASVRQDSNDIGDAPVDSSNSIEQLIACPFCGDNDFDKIGLKYHLEMYCEEYMKTERI